MTDDEYNQLYMKEVVKKFWEAYGVDYPLDISELENNSDKKPEPQTSKQLAKCGEETPAFRQDLSTEMMVSLRMENYTYRMIAEKLGCSPSTVRNRLRSLGMT